MNLKLAIVGLPNVGKSTLFNAVTKSAKAEAANFPFCTIEPNVGLVSVPDKRLNQLAEIVKPERIMASQVEFVDVAGLVRGASEGEGLGNKFLSHIRECQAVCHVLRAFEDENVHHVSAKVSPKDDLETILTELILADLQSVNKQVERLAKKSRGMDKESQNMLDLLTRIKTELENGNPAINVENESDDEEKARKSTFLLTDKPFLIIANVSEEQAGDFDVEKFRNEIGEMAKKAIIVPICAKTEAELAELDEADQQEFLESLGLKESGLGRLIHAGFDLLGLQSYFTAGVKEVRSWTIKKGDTAPRAAAAIHTDFEKGFIKADIIGFADYIEHGGEKGAKEAGKLRQEGKEYVVADGDVIHFKFNV